MFTKERILKSGRKAVVRELTGLDEATSWQFIHETYQPKQGEKNVNPLGFGMIQRSILTLLSVVDYDGKQLIPSDPEDALQKLGGIPRKDWMELVELYTEVNEERGDGTDFLQEQTSSQTKDGSVK